MYLILTAAAAIVSTVVWYAKLPDTRYRIGFLSLMYWGATLMWTVDHVIAYLQEGGPVFDTSFGAFLLGIVVVLAGLIIWLIRLLAADPKKVLRKALLKG